MDGEYDRAESLHFLDLLDKAKGDPVMIARVIGAVVLLIFKDPYWAVEEYPGGMRVLHSEAVVFDGITYAVRVAYRVEEYPEPREGKRGKITLESAEEYDVGDILDERPWSVREH
jgi:hypothetical protein